MPRKGPGGRRQGKIGEQYANRSDLRGAQPFKGQPYGVAKQQEQSLAAVPVTGQPDLTSALQGLSVPPPGSLGAFNRPTETSDPVTTGLPSGPGAGPEVLAMGQDASLAQLKAIYRVYPNPDLRALIEEAEGRA
jgi:hypothetical protein